MTQNNAKYPWDDIGAAVIEQYLAGKSTPELGVIFNIPYQSIAAYLRKSGVLRSMKEAQSIVEYRDRTCLICNEQYSPASAHQKYCKTCIPNHKAANRFRALGVSQRDFDRLFAKQKGICALCPSPATHLDHSHETRIVRGLLCMFCNASLNRMEIDGWNERATEYLSRDTGIVARVPMTVRQCWLIWKLIDSLRAREIPFEGPSGEFTKDFEQIRTICLDRAFDYKPEER
jgi:hypothetical protein